MGAKLTIEQEGLLQNYRDTVLELFDVAMNNTTLQRDNVSMIRLTLAKEQLEALNCSMLVMFAKAWLKGCSILHDVELGKDAHMLMTPLVVEGFVADLQKADVKLPNNGNAMDIYNVVEPLSYANRVKIITLFYASIFYLHQIDIPELKV